MIPGILDLDLWKGSTFGPIIIYAREEDQVTVVPLTGWAAYAKVRQAATKPVILDLLPYISDGPNGQITVPQISDESTALLSQHGCFVWDLLLERPSGEILGPFLMGAFTIHTAVSRA